MYCLWKKSASEGHDYVMTQAGGGYNDPSASCTGSKPASDFTLKFEGCAAKTDTGKCLTDLCLWERKGTGGNLTLTHAGSDNAAVDCKQSPPSGAPTFVDRECMFTKDPNCISDVCLFSDCDEVGFCGPECGDGIIMSPEECDDHNTQNGDGCDSQCKKGNGSSSSSSPACGNGTRNGAEECDDGNTKDGDGCSASCTDEPGYQCLAPLPFCPGNQRVLHPKVTCKKGSDGKYPLTCAPPYAAGMHLEAASQVELTYSVAGAGHCAQTRLRVNIDGTEVGVTNFIGSEISGGALSTSIQLGSVAAGDHSVTLIGEGDGNACGGVSDGLGAWAGTVTLAATADQCGDGKHAPVCGDGVCAAEEGCKFGSGKAVGECTTTAPCALDCDYGSMTVTQCTDTDNGANLSVRGTLSAKDPENQTLAFTDFCPSDKRIREFACSSPTKLSWNDLGCASCSAGQCQ
jgi:cysteine-rich repeat protein